MTVDVNSSSPMPRYYRVKLEIEKDITDGKLQPGDMLPSERGLCEKFGVSSITIRRALRELVQAGLIYRENGVGTFVASRTRRFSVALIFVGFEEKGWHIQSQMFGALIGSVGQVVWESGSTLCVTNVISDRSFLKALNRIVEERTFDGVLLRTSGDPPTEAADLLLSHRFPHVFVKKRVPERAANCVVLDNYRSSYIATRHLIEQGHSRIACLVGRPTRTFTDRAAGYRAALEDETLSLPTEYLHYGPSEFVESGYDGMLKLLRLPERPTAVVIGSDHMARGVYQAIRECNLVVGDDIALVSFDEMGLAEHYEPPLSALGPFDYDLGQHSARLLMQQLSDESSSPSEIVLDPQFIVRASSSKRFGDSAA